MQNGGEEATGQNATIADLQNLLQQVITIQHGNATNTTNATVRSNRAKAKPERPSVKQNSSDGDWRLFLDSWNRYKQMSHLTDIAEIRNELRCACSPEVNKLLFDIVGPTVLDACNENALLQHIKSVAVQGSHKEVHRQKFQALSQEEGEVITNYLAKLQAQAQLCDFQVECPGCNQSVSYTTNMVSGQLIAGLHNPEHQAKVLAEAATLNTLQLKFDKLVSLETTDQATKRLNMVVNPGGGATSLSSTMATSTYQRSNQRNRGGSSNRGRGSPSNRGGSSTNRGDRSSSSGGPPPNVIPCKGCGLTFHPEGKSMKRSDCPAFNKECRTCGIVGHLEKVCKKRAVQTTNNNQQPRATPTNVSRQNVSFDDSVQVVEEDDESYLFATETAEDKEIPAEDGEKVEWWNEEIVDRVDNQILSIVTAQEHTAAAEVVNTEEGIVTEEVIIVEEIYYIEEIQVVENVPPQQEHSQQEPSIELSSVSHCNMLGSLEKTTTSFALTTAQSVPDAIPHMEWNDSEFIRQAPKPSPKMEVIIEVLANQPVMSTMAPLPSSYVPRKVRVTALADSGAQTCSSGMELLSSLGCRPEHVIPTSHGIKGVTNTRLQIVGVLPVLITSGRASTKQLMYFCEDMPTRGCLLSEKALIDLRLLSKEFQSLTASTVSDPPIPPFKHEKATCGCYKRSPPPPFPSKIPFTPTKENVPKLEAWIKRFFAASAFNTCPHQKLPAMSGDLMNVTLKKDAIPHAVHTPIPIPLHWEQEVLKELKKDVALGIIEPVPSTTPTTWCSRAVILPKKDGTPRRTVSLVKPNEATVRHHHHTPSPFQQAIKVPAQTWKAILDAWNGYHSILLHPAARDLFTFIIKWGRFRYLRCPMGYHSSGDVYTHHFDEITKDFTDNVRQVDDSLLWKVTIAELFWHVMRYIAHCHFNGIIFNHKKFFFGRQEIEFAGLLLTSDGIKPSPRIVDAIRKFPTPTNITDIRSWFGLVNQCAYTFSQTEIMAPFRDLLKKHQKFYWDDHLEKLFQTAKIKIIEQIEDGIKTFDCFRATCLATDWCKTGLGFFLFQQRCRCQPIEGPYCGGGHWVVCFAGSRFTTAAESRYAPIEGEALAVVFGLTSCRMFVLGCPRLLVSVDHKPLLQVLGNQPLEEIKNPRLQRLKEKTMMYDFKIKHTPGRQNKSADAASRHPVDSETSSISLSLAHVAEQAPEEESEMELSLISSTMSIISDCPQFQAVTWDRIKEAGKKDKEFKELASVISSGFPHSKKELPGHLRSFWSMREELFSVDGVPALHDGRILIPHSLRGEVLECLHSAHQGVTGMAAHAKKRFFWPGMSSAIQLTRAQCNHCNSIAPSQSPEPFLETKTPEFPFQETATDLFHLQGHKFILYVDRFTAWVEIAQSKHTDASTVCDYLRRWYTTFGIPEEQASDGGPPYDSNIYKKFLTKWGVRQRLSSAHFPQSNGRAELGVKSAKRLLAANIDSTGSLDRDSVAQALMVYRNTPLQDSALSPAELLFGRTLRDHLPLLIQKIPVDPKWNKIREAREIVMAEKVAARVQKTQDSHKELQQLNPGQHVLIQNGEGRGALRWDRSGVVVEVLPHRQYRVRVDGSGRPWLRNRIQLKPYVPQSPPALSTTPSSSIVIPERPPLRPPTTQIPPAQISIPRPVHASTPNRSDRVTTVDEDPTWRMSLPSARPLLTSSSTTHPTEKSTTQIPTNDSTIPYDMTVHNHNEVSVPGTRRSTRPRTVPQRLSPKMKGKTHVR